MAVVTYSDGENARQALRILIGFHEILDGAVKIEDKLLVAGEITRVARMLSDLSRKEVFSDDASAAGNLLADFARQLPEYDNRDFKNRRNVLNMTKEIITHIARIVATSNKIAKDDAK
ncbi:MAG: hypothetical protein V1820_05470 [archaeon]